MISPDNIGVYRYLINELRKDPTLHKVVFIYPEEIIKLVEAHQQAIVDRDAAIKDQQRLRLKINEVIMENIKLRDELRSLKNK